MRRRVSGCRSHADRTADVDSLALAEKWCTETGHFTHISSFLNETFWTSLTHQIHSFLVCPTSWKVRAKQFPDVLVVTSIHCWHGDIEQSCDSDFPFVRVCVWVGGSSQGWHPEEGQLLIRPLGKGRLFICWNSCTTHWPQYTPHRSSGNDLICVTHSAS